TVNINNVSIEANVHGTIQRVGGILGSTLVYNLFKFIDTTATSPTYNTDISDYSNNFFMRNCSFKGNVTLSELPKNNPLYTKNARVAGLFAASNSGGWLPGKETDFVGITVQDFEVSNNTVEGIISGPRSVGRFFCFHSSSYTHVYPKDINNSLANYVHDNTFVAGGDVRGILSTDTTPIISLMSYLEGDTLTYVPVN
ncbi:MAG: hypothetical protein PHO21_03140, partial [Bacilli bacterium]|nr:hypothetical protein [Bacilli bacterium]